MQDTHQAARIDNVNIESLTHLPSPGDIKNMLPMSQQQTHFVAGSRSQISDILDHKNNKFLVIAGPCSIHDPQAALDYARRLQKLSAKHSDTLLVIMRVYFEKPRTSLGWRGLVIDPCLDGSYNIQEGLTEARKLLLDIVDMGLPAGTEVLDPIIPQYIADLVSWAAIGARTTESQIHREISSGLSMPVGFKNGTDGDPLKAVNAIQSALHGHSFIGIDQDGKVSVLKTRGNRTGHLIMRGGSKGPNYHEPDIVHAEHLLSNIGFRPSLIIDCSHANSGKEPANQSRVLRAVLEHVKQGHNSIRGIMLESHLVAGRQDIGKNFSSLTYGQSITDACIGWEETEELIEQTALQIRNCQ